MFVKSTTYAEMVGRKVVGGYEPMDDLENEQVRKAAAFAVQALTTEQVSYSFVSDGNLQSIQDSDVRIIRGFRQVVAGLNYRLILALTQKQQEEEKCLGAFAVTIYDHFGDLSVTLWGNEIECSRDMAALENEDLKDALANDFSN